MANSPADVTSQGKGEILRAWLNNMGVPAPSMGEGELMSLIANGAILMDASGESNHPTGTVAATLGRAYVASQTIALASGTLGMAAVTLVKGMVITNINVLTGSTAGATLTHQWAALYSGPAATPIVVAVSADGTSGAIGANAVLTYALTTPYTVPTSGVYYVGVLVTNNAGTQPTFAGAVAGNVASANIAPILGGTSNTGLTTPQAVGTTATAITGTVNVIYSYLT